MYLFDCVCVLSVMFYCNHYRTGAIKMECFLGGGSIKKFEN